MDTEPLNVTMHNLMPSVLSSLRGREGGKQECRQKYRWLVLKSKEEKSFSLFFLKIWRQVGCEVPQECVLGWTGKLSTRYQ